MLYGKVTSPDKGRQIRKILNGENMTELKLHDIVIMKKPHPCGCKEFEILRLGVDYRLKCCGCGREVMVPRIKAEKNIRGVKNV